MELVDAPRSETLEGRLRREQPDLSRPASWSFRGAALFADLSQYTPLAEKLCRTRAGREQLAHVLGALFRESVRAVHETGGEIACFAGDACMACWRDEHGLALERAKACADRLHAAASSFVPQSLGVRTSMHVGVAEGELWAAHLGDAGRWQLLLAGDAVRRACDEGRKAAPGETGVWPARSLAPIGEIGRKASSARPWIPKVTEHRPQLCALFVQVHGVDEHTAGALERHQAVVTALRGVLALYTRSSGTLLLNDKGLVYTVCFGLRADTHADDLIRAVRAGWAIRAELARMGYGCAVGIADGSGVSLELAGPAGRVSWGVGQAMHVADRLMQAAGSGVLCTDRVQTQGRRVASFAPAPPLRVKGVDYPLQVFRVLDVSDVQELPERLYGREPEQRTLDDCLDALGSERGAVLWMSGAAGLGKSALVHYARNGAAARGLRTYSGGAASDDVAAGYGAWRPVFDALLLDQGADWATRLEHPELAPLVNAVKPGLLPETSAVASLTGQARADATLRVLADAVCTLAGERFVLVLEDCHWMDPASWRLALRVARRCPRALIVLTSRPPERAEVSALRRLPHFVEMTLAPLRDDAIAAIVESVLGGEAPSPGLLSEITSRSHGNAFYAREHALVLASQPWRLDLVAPEPIDRSFDADGENPVPTSVANAILSRLDSLSTEERDVIDVASVINDAFSLELMQRACAGKAAGHELEARLQSLVDKQLLAREGAVDRFVFQHAIARGVVYGTLASDAKRVLHRRVAEAIETTGQQDLRPYFATLAFHWDHADEPATTVRWADQAAAQALAAGAFLEAKTLLTLCITKSRGTLAPDRLTAVRWQCQLADALQGMGDLEERRSAAQAALRHAGRRRAQRRPRLAMQAAGSLALIARRLAFRRPPQHAEELLVLARAYRHSAEVCYFDNDAMGMLCDDLSAVAYGWLPEPSAVFVGAATELGGIMSVTMLRPLGEWIIRKTIAVAEDADGRSAQAYAHMINGLYYIGVGDWESAKASVERCQDICDPMEDRVNWTNAQAVRFWMSHHQGHEDAAYNAACHLRDRASETGNRQHQAWGARCLAVCAMRRNRWHEARAHAKAAFDSLGGTAMLNEKIPTRGLYALALLQTGDGTGARATAREVLPLLGRIRRPIAHGSLEGYAGLGTVALAAWQDRPDDWQESDVQACLDLLDRYRSSFAIGAPRYLLHCGHYLRARGAIDAARQHYERGKHAAERLGMPWEHARCREAIASIDSERSDPQRG